MKELFMLIIINSTVPILESYRGEGVVSTSVSRDSVGRYYVPEIKKYNKCECRAYSPFSSRQKIDCQVNIRSGSVRLYSGRKNIDKSFELTCLGDK